MTKEATVSWIFLAIAKAAQGTQANEASILNVADAINHAIPTKEELQLSFEWLIHKKLIQKQGSKYSLTQKGEQEYELAHRDTTVLFKVWERLEQRVKEYI